MVTLLLDQTRLEIVLSATERALAFRRESLTLERKAIRRVQLTDEPWTWLRGIRAAGTHVPGAIAMGTWRASKGTDFVVLNGRKRHGVVIELVRGESFSRVILSTRHGLALVQALRLDDVPEASDVAELAAASPRKSGGKKSPGSDPAPARKPAPKRVPAPRPAPAS
ncbi:hypothetical protein [Microbacterium sp. Marseille-Q6965]|uniref:hypothetical protein n=1 Tax=Microbacterium sp. Marseille-Q6965 TaxID=2965072 RepID=UPI0021B77225|nr:hypothetical protein [Microbacterium sp. Marseille-Q6965]